MRVVTGYRGETLTALGRCSNFSLTTNFFFQVWEALYSHMYLTFQKTNLNTAAETQEPFLEFLQQKQCEDDNQRFWIQFIRVDCLAFINLYLSVRAGNWKLRCASIKQMAALFTVCDRPHYTKIISQHRADCLEMPQSIVSQFSAGGFVVSIKGRSWHSVAYDEAHEMLINKELKTAIVRPNHEYMSRLALYFAHRTQALKNLSSITEVNKYSTPDTGETTTGFSDMSSSCIKKFENVNHMISAIESSLLLPHPKPECSTLRNSFISKIATPEQRSDLLGFREIGQKYSPSMKC